ncbi:MAG: TetR/AcrR family transcriptional regulator [Tractidigestivibacter sp.]|jgi:AcrR family transcriptional regulator|uniref:TetR/AcrR family transcriptional regulator n=1 Tax=Tractidigestivibacter sp. TaxID=2847320 RepID=UPI003D8D6DDD
MKDEKDEVHTDLRVIRTRHCIENALLELMQTNSLGKLSVSQICDAALVNKGTFYRYYQDKYDLASRTASELLTEMDQLLRQRFAARIGTHSKALDSSNTKRLNEVVGGLILLRDVEVDRIPVRDRVRRLIASLLQPYADEGLISEDVETEAWVLSMILFDYPTYAKEVKRPLRPAEYARSVQEVVGIYEQVFQD